MRIATTDTIDVGDETVLHVKAVGRWIKPSLMDPGETPDVTVFRVDTWDDEMEEYVVILGKHCAPFATLYEREIEAWLEQQMEEVL